MDVDQAGNHELAARIERRRRWGTDRGLDGDNAAPDDGDVPDGVEPQRRIDDTTAANQKVIPSALRPEPAGPADQCGAGGRGCPDELASIHCRAPPRP